MSRKTVRVPREANEKMVRVGLAALRTSPSGGDPEQKVQEVWKAMCRARPRSQAEEEASQ
jgi:hypothetical protein